MIYFPYFSETLVLPVQAKEVTDKLFTKVLPEQEVMSFEKSLEEYLYVGTTGTSWFIIYRKLHQPDNFLPLIYGRLEGTSVGCILFLTYKLFKSTIIFLTFWSFISLSLSSYLFSQKLFFEGSVTLLLGIGNYFVTIANFNRNLVKDRNLIRKLLE